MIISNSIISSERHSVLTPVVGGLCSLTLVPEATYEIITLRLSISCNFFGFLLPSSLLVINPFLLICVLPHGYGLLVMPGILFPQWLHGIFQLHLFSLYIQISHLALL